MRRNMCDRVDASVDDNYFHRFHHEDEDNLCKGTGCCVS